MDKEQIKHIALQMKSREDLLSLLNRIKRDEMEELGYADKFHPFTIRHMNYYCNPKNAFHRYRQFKIKKKSGGTKEQKLYVSTRLSERGVEGCLHTISIRNGLY